MSPNTAILVVALAAASQLAGCASQQNHPTFAVNSFQLMAMRSPQPYEAAILFDREPGDFYAEQFNIRSDWPSTPGYIRSPEVMTYFEQFIDRQGRGNHDYTYRRAETRRYMTGYR